MKAPDGSFPYDGAQRLHYDAASGGDGGASGPMVTGSSRPSGVHRRALSFALRFGIAAAIIGWLIREAGWQDIVAAWRDADGLLLLAALAALTLEVFSKAWNWARLLDNLGCTVSSRFGRLLHVYLVGTLAGTVLPSTASTDAMRALLAQRVFGGRPTAHAAAIIIQNLLVWIAACSIGLVCIGVLLAADAVPAYASLVALLFAGVVIGGVAAHVALKYYRWLWVLSLRRVLRRRFYAIRRAVRRLADALLIFERAHVRFAPRALVAVLAATSSASVFAAVGTSVGIELPITVWGAVIPLIALTALLPISISGLGGAQAVHVLLLAPFGVSVSQAFAASTLHALLNLGFTAIAGTLAWLFGPDVLTRSSSEA